MSHWKTSNGVVVKPGQFQVYGFRADSLVDPVAILNAQAMTGAGSVDLAYKSPDQARSLSLSATGADTWSVVVEGLDGYGRTKSETVTVIGGAAAVTSVHGYEDVTKVSWSGGTSGNLSVGIEDEFALPVRLVCAGCLFYKAVDNTPDGGTLTFYSILPDGQIAPGKWAPAGWSGIKKFDICYQVKPIF